MHARDQVSPSSTGASMTRVWLALTLIIAAWSIGLPARASALVVHRERTATTFFAGNGCSEVVTRRIAVTLARGSRDARASGPESGEILLDDNGLEVAEVVSVTDLERNGRRASVTLSVK